MSLVRTYIDEVAEAKSKMQAEAYASRSSKNLQPSRRRRLSLVRTYIDEVAEAKSKMQAEAYASRSSKNL